MNIAIIPSAADVRERLASMKLADVEALSKRCSVPLPTLVKIRNGQTEDPRIETVRAIWAQIGEVKAA